MTKGRFNQNGANRAIAYSITLERKLAKRKEACGINKLEDEIAQLNKKRVGIVCSECKNQHFVTVAEYRSRHWRSICRECFEKQKYDDVENSIIRAVTGSEEISKIIRATGVSRSAPRTCISFYIDRPEYDPKAKR